MAECRLSRGHGPGTAGGRSRLARRITTAVLSALPIILMTSCSTVGPDTAAAAGVAAAFHRALRSGDGGVACSLLAPATAEEMQGRSGQDCPRAILAEEIPDAADVQDSQAFGHGAQVLMAGDVVFLSAFGTRWLITAAGCRPRDRPYDCTLNGG